MHGTGKVNRVQIDICKLKTNVFPKVRWVKAIQDLLKQAVSHKFYLVPF